MPEGPEVWILSNAINHHFAPEPYYPNEPLDESETDSRTTVTFSYGKHLLLLNERENWSFGLDGKCVITDDNQLVKPNVSWIHGHQLTYEYVNEVFGQLGVSWFHANEDVLRKEIAGWNTSKTKLAGVLLNQTKLSGVGVAWGSEILHRANLSPDKRACDQDLSGLADVMIKMRDEIKEMYASYLDGEYAGRSKQFVNEWFNNLYKLREPYMQVYKKGTSLKVLGRTWWV